MARKRALRRADLVTEAQYAALLEGQSGVCAICGNPPKEGGRALHVDHDHRTGEVRGLLCHYCNRFIVGPGIRPSKLLSGALYLARAGELSAVAEAAIYEAVHEAREAGR